MKKHAASRKSPRCHYQSSSGRRCRLSVSAPGSEFCRLHAKLAVCPEPDLSAALTGGLEEFSSPATINEFLSRLLVLTVREPHFAPPRRRSGLHYQPDPAHGDRHGSRCRTNSQEASPRESLGPPLPAPRAARTRGAIASPATDRRQDIGGSSQHPWRRLKAPLMACAASDLPAEVSLSTHSTHRSQRAGLAVWENCRRGALLPLNGLPFVPQGQQVQPGPDSFPGLVTDEERTGGGDGRRRIHRRGLVADLRRQGFTKIRAVDIKPLDEWYQVFDGVENLVAGPEPARRTASAVAEGAARSTTSPPTWAAWASSRRTRRCACSPC